MMRGRCPGVEDGVCFNFIGGIISVILKGCVCLKDDKRSVGGVCGRASEVI